MQLGVEACLLPSLKLQDFLSQPEAPGLVQDETV